MLSYIASTNYLYLLVKPRYPVGKSHIAALAGRRLYNTLWKHWEDGSFVLIEFLIAFEVFIKYYIAACLLKLQYGTFPQGIGA